MSQQLIVLQSKCQSVPIVCTHSLYGINFICQQKVHVMFLYEEVIIYFSVMSQVLYCAAGRQACSLALELYSVIVLITVNVYFS